MDTKKPQPSEFRQDLLRGIRWGTILLIAMLLSIAAYRVLSSSPATASEPKSAEIAVPAVDVEPATETAIKVVEAEPKSASHAGETAADFEVPAVPAKNARVVRKAPAQATNQFVEPPQRLQAPAFTPQPAITPAAKSNANAFLAEPTPVAVDAPAPSVEIPSSKNPALAPPPATDKSKDGNRATRAVRSVGRFFRLGKKENEAKQGDASK